MRKPLQFFLESKASLLIKGSKSKFVADAEIYNLNELKEKYNIAGRNSYEVLSQLTETFLVQKGEFANQTSLTNLLFLKKIEGAYAFAYWMA
ncbi:hypothetical protein C5S31_00200, partial [ANME-1 cluster archaeon GoMg2]|nr:hypothetical protein [ANME-1 cluster archaeon GoMg2]